MHFDPRSGDLTPLRSKEEAHDYRYFPEPDLVPLAPTDEMVREARESLPELPAARIERYRDAMGLPVDTASLLAGDPDTAEYFEQVAAAASEVEPRTVANWVTGDLAGALRQLDKDPDARPEPQRMARVIGMVAEKRISHQSGRETVYLMVQEPETDPDTYVQRKNLLTISADSGELDSIVDAAIDANPNAAEQVRAGNGKAIGAIVGAVMKETKGRADGGEVNRLIKKKLAP
jgi:aspartyl-tRNA(Asn)/glutamyl-tRNA(Gln) amidotransferase subunit B